MTCAISWVVPPTGSALSAEVSVMVDPDGASSGTLSQLVANAAAARTHRAAPARRRAIATRENGDNMKALTILVSMDLRGQGQSRGGERGYAMAALLVAMSIMEVMMTVALPVWKQNAQREKEEELIFRGKQYVHAIGLFQRKFAGTYPPNLNVLVEQKFLRKKYKDPMTDDDFVPIPFGQAQPGPAAATPGG